MIAAESKTAKYQTEFTNGIYTAVTDAPRSHGGAGASFSPGELVEAAMACCTNTILRVSADSHNVPLEGAKVTVEMKSDDPEETVFECKIELKGNITEAQRKSLLHAAAACPVKKALSKKIVFKTVE